MRFAYQAYMNSVIIEFANFCRSDKAFVPHPAWTSALCQQYEADFFRLFNPPTLLASYSQSFFIL